MQPRQTSRQRTVAVSEDVSVFEPAAEPAAEPAVTLPEPLAAQSTVRYVRVRADARWQSIMAAGRMFTKEPTEIHAEDPIFPELSTNQYLEISETLWPAQ